MCPSYGRCKCVSFIRNRNWKYLPTSALRAASVSKLPGNKQNPVLAFTHYVEVVLDDLKGCFQPHWFYDSVPCTFHINLFMKHITVHPLHSPQPTEGNLCLQSDFITKQMLTLCKSRSQALGSPPSEHCPPVNLGKGHSHSILPSSGAYVHCWHLM